MRVYSQADEAFAKTNHNEYFVSNDFKTFTSVKDRDAGLILADIMNGFVFVCYGDENVIVYHSKDAK